MGGNEGPLSPAGCSLSSLSPTYLLSFLIKWHASSSAPCGGDRMKTTACTDAEFKTTSLLHTYHKDATCVYVLHREKTTPPTLNKTSHRPLSHQTLSCLLLLINHTVMWTLLLKMLKEDSLTSASGYLQGGGGWRARWRRRIINSWICIAQWFQSSVGVFLFHCSRVKTLAGVLFLTEYIWDPFNCVLLHKALSFHTDRSL